MDLLPLLAAARNGDKQAESELFSMLSVRFRLIAYRIIRDQAAAEDVAQEAALDVLKAYRDLDVRESFAAWARVVVRNRALKHLESRKRQVEMTVELDEHDQPGNVPSDDAGPHDLQERLLRCLGKLARVDKKYSRILNLTHLGYTITEICTRLEVKANHAYVILHRARRALKACLDTGQIAL